MESRIFKIIAITFIACLTFIACNKTKEEPYRLSYEDKALLSSGDIIMRRGEGILSTFIVNELEDSVNLSHCGIIVREGEKLDVIHCLSDKVSNVNGVQICSLDEFTQESIRGTISVVRCTSDTCGILADGARYYLKVRKKFDHHFDYNDTTEFFCSELPLHILSKRLGIEILDKDQEFKFSLFFNPAYFRTILPQDSIYQINPSK